MIVTCNIYYLRARCRERGYTLDEVMGCIVYRAGDQVSVDCAHSAYPGKARPGYVAPPPPTAGPGTELKKLLKSVGIEAKPDCSCNKRAQLMDHNEATEPGWCEAHIEEISGWLQEEAHKRGLPYIASAGKLLIRMAIRRAKRGNGSV